MPHLTGLRVTHSAIHGYGVITTRRFAKGELVLEGDGVLYREDDEFDDTYALVLPGWGADGGDDPDAPEVYYDLIDQTRWINHSCDPNVYIERAWVDGQPQVVMRAWRRIEVGDELAPDDVGEAPLEAADRGLKHAIAALLVDIRLAVAGQRGDDLDLDGGREDGVALQRGPDRLRKLGVAHLDRRLDVVDRVAHRRLPGRCHGCAAAQQRRDRAGSNDVVLHGNPS